MNASVLQLRQLLREKFPGLATRAAGEQVKMFLPKPFTTKTLLDALNQVLA